jgi:hypothetical protein
VHTPADLLFAAPHLLTAASATAFFCFLICTANSPKRRVMPGFLSAYEGTTYIDLGDLVPGYWVKVKKSLSSTELGWAQTAMGADRQRLEGNGNQYADLNVKAFQHELIVQSLDSWNLTDADDAPLPLDAGQTAPRRDQNPYPPGCPRRVSVGRLPAVVFARIYDACNDQMGDRDTAEAATFPDGTERGGLDGDAGPADPSGLPG